MQSNGGGGGGGEEEGISYLSADQSLRYIVWLTGEPILRLLILKLLICMGELRILTSLTVLKKTMSRVFHSLYLRFKPLFRQYIRAVFTMPSALLYRTNVQKRLILRLQ
jgi:hypothetical protein